MTYWGPKPAWQHVAYRFIPNNASRTAALLAGDVDFIDFVPTEDLAKLRKDPKVKLWEALGLRLIFLGLDQSRDGPSPFVTGPNGEQLDKNPLKDRRVRHGAVARDQPPGDRGPSDGGCGGAVRPVPAAGRLQPCRPTSSRRHTSRSRRRSCWRRRASRRASA